MSSLRLFPVLLHLKGLRSLNQNPDNDSNTAFGTPSHYNISCEEHESDTLKQLFSRTQTVVKDSHAY